MKQEVHLFILWEKAQFVREKILNDISARFTILKQYEITWTASLVAQNFTRFCGTRLGNNLQFKIDNCGTGEFLVVVVRDEHPEYVSQNTFHGLASVNKQMFEAKQRYREWTGGGVRVHATDNTIETNRDLTLLIGKNVEDFLRTLTDSKVEKLHKDLEGASGWNTIEQLFYVLNNTVRYAIMRGYSELSIGDFLDHGDVDIMTDDYDNLWLMVNSPQYNPNVKPKANVTIGTEHYLLDIWNCGTHGMNYFDPRWSKVMLDTAVVKNGVRVLNVENDFYCLLYHCLTNKGYIADDYLIKLQRYKSELGLEKDDWNVILVDFLRKNEYEVIRPIDTNNPFNLSNPIIGEYALRNGGVCIVSNVQMKVYDTGENLHFESPLRFADIKKTELMAALSPGEEKQQTSKRDAIKGLCKKFLPKRTQRLLFKIWRLIKRI